MHRVQITILPSQVPFVPPRRIPQAHPLDPSQLDLENQGNRKEALDLESMNKTTITVIYVILKMTK